MSIYVHEAPFNRALLDFSDSARPLVDRDTPHGFMLWESLELLGMEPSLISPKHKLARLAVRGSVATMQRNNERQLIPRLNRLQDHLAFAFPGSDTSDLMAGVYDFSHNLMPGYGEGVTTVRPMVDFVSPLAVSLGEPVIAGMKAPWMEYSVGVTPQPHAREENPAYRRVDDSYSAAPLTMNSVA